MRRAGGFFLICDCHRNKTAKPGVEKDKQERRRHIAKKGYVSDDDTTFGGFEAAGSPEEANCPAWDACPVILHRLYNSLFQVGMRTWCNSDQVINHPI